MMPYETARTTAWIQLYLDEKRKILDSLPVEKISLYVEWILNCYDARRTLFLMGNGGNAGTMDHLYCDFKHHPFVSEDKGAALPYNIPRLKCINLCASPAELSGLVNDLGVDAMFAGALAPYVAEQDVVLGVSGSGNSKNILNAFKVARERGAKTVAITKGEGGACRTEADLCIVIPGTSAFPGQTGKNDNNFHFEDAVLYINTIALGILKQHVLDLSKKSEL